MHTTCLSQHTHMHTHTHLAAPHVPCRKNSKQNPVYIHFHNVLCILMYSHTHTIEVSADQYRRQKVHELQGQGKNRKVRQPPCPRTTFSVSIVCVAAMISSNNVQSASKRKPAHRFQSSFNNCCRPLAWLHKTESAQMCFVFFFFTLNTLVHYIC